MPQYLYEHIESGEVVEIFQHMKDEHIFCGQNGDEKGQWRRVWTVPQASIDSKIDPFSKRDFVEKTGRKKGTYGDLLDAAKEAHEQRVAKEGRDTVKEKFLTDYKKTNGIDHFSAGKPKVINKNGIKVEL